MNQALSRLVLPVICVMICFIPGIFGSYFSPGEWYVNLTKPALTPPGWLFPIVWTALYLMMGGAMFLVLISAQKQRLLPAITVFILQLVLNGLWSWLFFGLHRPDLALIEISLLWFLILISMILFWRIRPLAGWLLLPYLLWVGFAAWLNFWLWRLN